MKEFFMLLFEEANSIFTELLNNLVVLFTSINWDIMFFAGLGFAVLFAIFYLIKSRFSYESRMVKKLLRLNNWLNKNRYIDQNNLIEFNNLMKKTPKHLRYYWHEYMLNREKEPSHYMSTYNLVEKPIKSSSYTSNIKNFKTTTILMAGFITLFAILKLSTVTPTFSDIAMCVLTPLIMILFYGIVSIIMRASQNMTINSLYQYVHYYGRFLDRAVTTMPDYVDFEVLFTRREIKKGIPVLNEYLEKRARQEQEELEKARINAVEHETYDFSSTGINGALVLERAINESETYINIRSRLLSEIQQLEDEIESIKRTYENTEKDYQKKMQVSKENVDRLRKQQEETTNRIENNYIKKQQADEIKKQEQLEKDHDAATIRFNQEIEGLTSEIETRRKELEERRQYVEEAMKAEYQSFSTKLYKSLTTILQEESEDEKAEILEIKDEIASKLAEANETIAQKDREIAELQRLLKGQNVDYNAYVGFSSDTLKKESKKRKSKKDAQQGAVKEVQTQAQIMASLAPTSNFANDPNLIPLSQIREEDRQYGEDGGFYDPNGYYRYPNGTYFTPTSEFHDEFGGWYEADAVTYHAPDPALVESIINAPPQNLDGLKRMAEVPENERQYSDDGGFFDKEGYYYYPNGTYFTPDGRYFDEYGGWFEPDGVTYHKPETTDEDGNPLEMPAVNNEGDKIALKKLKEEELKASQPQEKQMSEQALKEIGNLRSQFNIEVAKEQPQDAKPAVKEEPAPAVEEPVIEEEAPQVEEKVEEPVEPAPAQETPVVDIPVVEEAPVVQEPMPVAEEKVLAQPEPQAPVEEEVEIQTASQPVVEEVPQATQKPQPKKEEKIAIYGVNHDEPKPATSQDLFAVAPPVEEAPKRKAGRPRKILSQEEIDALANKEKRGRGRPRKILSIADLSSASTEPQEKRGRGRPKKVVSDEDNQAEKRGRGRPRKSVASSEFDSLMAGSPEQEELDKLNAKIESENKRLAEHQEEFNNQINETLFRLSSDDD